MFFKMVEPTESRKSLASLPYCKGVTELLTHVLKKHDVTVANKPFTTLQQQFPAPKFQPPMESQTNIVYKIPCTNCFWCFIGETGRAFITRKKKIWETPKLQPKVLELLITPGPTTMPLILKTCQLLTKALLEPEKHYKCGIPEWHLMQITIFAHYQLGSTTFFLTNIHNYLHFYYYVIHAFYSNFLIAFCFIKFHLTGQILHTFNLGIVNSPFAA